MHNIENKSLCHTMEDANCGILKLTCQYCSKVFAKISNKNAHIRNIHQEDVQLSKESRIYCPLCQEIQVPLRTYNNLTRHLEEEHNVCMNEVVFDFLGQEDYEIWKTTEKIEMRYAICRHVRKKDCYEKHYACNRSNINGHESNCKERTQKSGGSIRIKGICPSKLIVSFYKNGKITIKYQKTHAGHNENELRGLHLSVTEKNSIVEKLKCGISTERILEDARQLKNDNLQRINLLNRNDINYLKRKHVNKMHTVQISPTLEVDEWDANAQSFVFYFKPEGETHEILKIEDSALAFMTPKMEDTLKQFNRVICIDAIHCMNKKMYLTIMLTNDDKNAVFPVAFFLTNRWDQTIQEIFLKALKEKVEKEITPEYFMTNDDKYYNAWLKIMDNKPRRLLCTWHLMKNWNIQGRFKIKNQELKSKMKMDLKKILNEVNEEKFLYLVESYCNKLKNANELEFLNYVNINYFEPIKMQMWGHCYTKNVGVNTNMSIESINNFLNIHHTKWETKATVKKLLEMIDGRKEVTQTNSLDEESCILNSFIPLEERRELGEEKDNEREISSFIECEMDDGEIISEDDETLRNTEIKELTNFLKDLDEKHYSEFMEKIHVLRNEIGCNNNKKSNKRKIDNRECYFLKKQCN